MQSNKPDKGKLLMRLRFEGGGSEANCAISEVACTLLSVRPTHWIRVTLSDVVATASFISAIVTHHFRHISTRNQRILIALLRHNIETDRNSQPCLHL